MQRVAFARKLHSPDVMSGELILDWCGSSIGPPSVKLVEISPTHDLHDSLYTVFSPFLDQDPDFTVIVAFSYTSPWITIWGTVTRYLLEHEPIECQVLTLANGLDRGGKLTLTPTLRGGGEGVEVHGPYWWPWVGNLPPSPPAGGMGGDLWTPESVLPHFYHWDRPLSKELIRLAKRMLHYIPNGASMAAIIQHNGMDDPDHDIVRILLPNYQFAVRVEQLPENPTLPLHDGGWVHLENWKDMRYFLLFQLYRVADWFHTVRPPLPLDMQIEEWKQEQRKTKKLKGSPPRFQSSPTATIEIEDLDRLFSMMPPCLHALAKGGKFPGDQERQPLVRSLARGGISLRTVGQLMDHLNESYPHQPSPLPTLRRWDYRYHYERNYSPPSCEALASYCPFPQSQVWERKRECHARFMAQFPDKVRPTDAARFYGPYKWFQWVTTRSEVE